MVTWRSKPLKIVMIGVSSLAGLAYAVTYTNRNLSAEVPVKNVTPIGKDFISTIEENKPNIERESENRKCVSLIEATQAAQQLTQQTLTVNGFPGIVAGVSIKGKPSWVQGFGFSDVETATRCTKDTLFRLGSISKPLTMAVVAKLFEQGKLDLDKSVYDYLGDKFPVKRIDGHPVTMNLRQIASHTAGIRHYEPPNEFERVFKHYDKAMGAIELIAEDDLIAKPGTKFHYSTFGYILMAAVVESVLPDGKTFGDYLINNICRQEIGMNNTYLDQNIPVILNRSRQYRRDQSSLTNAPYVDSSYKYSSGGILSTVPDLLRFGNVMMYSSFTDSSKFPGFLKKSTIDMLWTPITSGATHLDPNLDQWSSYGLGWGLIRNAEPFYASGACPPFKDIMFHTGGSVGGTALLAIIPEKEMVIAVLCNLEKARAIIPLGLQIAELFINVQISNPVHSNHKEIAVKM